MRTFKGVSDQTRKPISNVVPIRPGGGVASNDDDSGVRGLTLSGTKTHVKQRFLPLTPLLMVSDVLWSPVLPA